MKVVVLAAGKGQRLRGIVHDVPKPMVKVKGKPVLEHNIEWLKKYEITELYINLHYLPDVIENYFGDGNRFGVNITYSYESHLLGTAGAVKKIADEYWGGKPDEPFIVAYGDNVLSDFELDQIMDFQNSKNGIGTVCLYHNPEQVSKSGVAVIDKNCRILKFVEKPSSGKSVGDLINTGIYILKPQILSYIPPGSVCDFGADVFPSIIADGQALYGIVMQKKLIAIDTPELFQRVVGKL